MLEHSVLKMKLTQLQEACHRADVSALLCMIDVIDFVLRRFSAVIAGGISLSGALRRTAEESELQTKFDRLVADLNKALQNVVPGVSSHGSAVVTLSTSELCSMPTYTKSGFLNVRIISCRKKNVSLLLSGTHVLKKWVVFRRFWISIGMCVVTLRNVLATKAYA